MRRYGYIPGAVLLALALILIAQGTAPLAVSLIILAAAIISLVMASRGTFFFVRGTALARTGKEEDRKKALRLFSRALACGLSETYQAMAATLLLQEGDIEEGRKYLEPLASSKDPKIRNSALVSLSMYFWATGNTEKAIKLCEEARNGGCRDRNLWINLCTYYLSAGKTNAFRAFLSSYPGQTTIAIEDLRAVEAMLRGDWKSAGMILHAVLSAESPAFADPYVHAAEVYLHYGERDAAEQMLRKAEEAVPGRFAVYSRETIGRMLRAVTDDSSCDAFASAAERNVLRIVNGKLPLSWEGEGGARVAGGRLPGRPSLPDFSIAAPASQPLPGSDEPDTDLGEDDEEWLRKHSLST